MTNIIDDLKYLVAKHDFQPAQQYKYEEPEPVIRWIPVCDKFKDADSCGVYKEKGGEAVARGKRDPAKVLFWCKVKISAMDGVKLVEVVKP